MAFFRILHQQNRTRSYDIALSDENGDDYVLQAADEVLVHIYRLRETPILTLSTWEVLSGGSFVSFTAATNDAVLKVCQADVPLTMVPGLYECEIIVLDDSDRVAWMHAAGLQQCRIAEAVRPGE